MAVFTGFSRNLWVAAAFLLLSGIANAIYYVAVISVTQREAPDRIRGRVMSTRFLLVQMGLLVGLAVAGPLAARVGAPILFVAVGFLLLSTALVGAVFRDLRDAAFHEDPVEPTIPAAVSG